MTVKLFGLTTDPDTDRARRILSQANINCEVVDVEKEGIVAYLDRDLDVKELPFILLQNGKIEGVREIEVFAHKAK